MDAGREEQGGTEAQRLANWSAAPASGGGCAPDNVLLSWELGRPGGIVIELVEVRTPLNAGKRRGEMKARV